MRPRACGASRDRERAEAEAGRGGGGAAPCPRCAAAGSLPWRYAGPFAALPALEAATSDISEEKDESKGTVRRDVTLPKSLNCSSGALKPLLAWFGFSFLTGTERTRSANRAESGAAWPSLGARGPPLRSGSRGVRTGSGDAAASGAGRSRGCPRGVPRDPSRVQASLRLGFAARPGGGGTAARPRQRGSARCYRRGAERVESELGAHTSPRRDNFDGDGAERRGATGSRQRGPAQPGRGGRSRSRCCSPCPAATRGRGREAAEGERRCAGAGARAMALCEGEGDGAGPGRAGPSRAGTAGQPGYGHGPRSGAGLERRLPRGEPGALAGRGLPVVPRLPGAVPPPARRPPRPGTSALRGSAPRAGAPSPGARRPRRCCAEPPSGPRRPRTPWSTGDAGRTGRPRQARKAPEDGGPAVPLRAAQAADWRSRAGRARSRPGPAAALPAAPGAAANGKQTLPRWWFCSTALCRFFCCCYLVRKLRNGERGARGAHSAHGAVREGRKLPRCTSR